MSHVIPSWGKATGSYHRVTIGAYIKGIRSEENWSEKITKCPANSPENTFLILYFFHIILIFFLILPFSDNCELSKADIGLKSRGIISM